MSFVPKKHCLFPGCYEEVPVHVRSSYCLEHRGQQGLISGDSKARRSKRGQVSGRNPLYGHRWEKAAKRYKLMHPACVQCGRLGTKANPICVDHIKPHRNDYDLFWDETNWQSLCKICHGRKSITERKDRRRVTVDGDVIHGYE